MSSDVVGRWRRAYPRIFRHPSFQRLTQSQQLLTLYLLFGPQSNRIGLFYFSTATAAEDLNMSPETFRKAFPEVLTTFNWHFDRKARVLFIPSWWRWNPPDHAKVLMGNLKDLSEVPPCALTEEFARNMAYLHPELHETFTEACRVRLPKGTPSQDQDQGSVSGKQKQDAGALRAPRAPTNSNHSDKLVQMAREVVQEYPQLTIEDSIEHLQSWASSRGHRIRRQDAIELINVATSERRANGHADRRSA